MKTLSSQIAEIKKQKSFHEASEDSIGTKICTNYEKNGFFALSCISPALEIPPSAKLSMAMAVILQWHSTHPEDKILGTLAHSSKVFFYKLTFIPVFTQFVMTGKVMGWMLRQAGIEFLYYYGECNDAARQKAIESFNEDSGIKVMVSFTPQSLAPTQSLNIRLTHLR